ncbi:MAG: hypothetical protein KKA68_21255, partial [Gammaproteobacteria bacterium]|nr:hypothetical protein [Gammaproteobacteria bacterium]
VDAAAAIGDSGTPAWAGPTTAPDYCAADTVITVTMTQGATQADDPMALLFFSVGEGGASYKGLGEITQCTSLFQVGSATTGAWVIEFPIPSQYMGCQASSSTTSATTHTMAGGAVDAAAEIGASGASTWLTPTTEPDYVAADTACTATITQSSTRADDPMIIHVWQLGEG